ncbi:N-acetyltransferase family protein [Bradyrhizobium sp. SYSU BS000235]|uniref:GNAT family N-acetyltransferase n=1 Tax=Bradyrhizobium sp. SYSU BS000235 TaxID=3411332 RepID=UPI003C71CD9A
MSSAFTLRPYRNTDEDAVIELWFRTWQQAYPSIDFSARLDTWRIRWRNELAPSARIIVAEKAASIVGFVTIDQTGYLDQLVVDPESWGSDLGNVLMTEAKLMSPEGITLLVNTDNARAIRFYTRNGFRHTHDDVNPVSGRLVYGMAWKP